tara:strand:+ start:358 stop:573 length:216 start_codon:yes stop_codon:yes gene_type:complete
MTKSQQTLIEELRAEKLAAVQRFTEIRPQPNRTIMVQVIKTSMGNVMNKEQRERITARLIVSMDYLLSLPT